MTVSEEPADLLDLPIFGSPATASGGPVVGRVRSTFRYSGPAAAVAGDDPALDVAAGPPALRVVRGLPPVPDAVGGSQPDAVGVDWLLVGRLRVEVARRLADRMGEARWSGEDQEAEGWAIIRTLLDEQAAEALATSGQPRSLAEQECLARAVFDACFRLGRLQPLIDDDRIENILGSAVGGSVRVVVEFSDGTLEQVDPIADSEEELAEFLAFLAARADNPRSFTAAQPSLHLVLPDGSRLAAARDTAGVSLVIRRHRVRQVSLQDLVDWGTLSLMVASFLRAAVRARLSIVVTGAQGAGKTTLLRALCAEIDPWEVLGTFESEYELFLHQMPQQHRLVYAWESREGSGERGPDGRVAGARSTADQIVDSFRFRLDRQILGEIRGAEVWSMIKLMESGSGSISTTHAANAHRAMTKLVTCAMEAGPQVSHELAASKLGETIDIVVHLACDVLPGDGDVAPRKNRYVEEVLHVTPGERPRGYATNIVFAAVRGGCAAAHTRPDELMDVLVRAGFDAAGFDDEVSAGGLS